MEDGDDIYSHLCNEKAITQLMKEMSALSVG